jgi:putative Ca2+/H+ antiporter (TMEM165/GDT1 family)
MSTAINDVFWAVFFGATLGTLTVNLISTIIDEYRTRKHHKAISLLVQEWDELDLEEE